MIFRPKLSAYVVLLTVASFTGPTTYCIGKSENFLQDLSLWVWRSGLLCAQYVSLRKGVWCVPDQDTHIFPQFPGHERNRVPFGGYPEHRCLPNSSGARRS